MTETTPTAAGAPKSRVAYILLAFFLGGWGIHNFYSGNKKHGIIKLVLFFLFVGLIVNPIWCIIEMITVTKDENGVNFN